MGPYPGRKDNTYVYTGPLAGRAGRFFTFEYVGKVHIFEALDTWVDAEAPVLAFDADLGTQPLRGMVEILGTVTDSRLTGWTLWALPNGNVEGKLLLGNGTTSLEDNVLAEWDTVGLDGEWLLVIEAGDSSGNRSELQQWVTVLNLTAPTLDPPMSPVSQSTITVTGQGLTGSIAYGSLNGVEIAQAVVGDGGSFSLLIGSLVEGENIITARLGDGRGHFGPISEAVTVTADFTRPVSSIQVGTPRYLGDITAVRSQTTFIIEATDVGTGVARIEYRVDENAWTQYEPFSIAGEGTHTIAYRCQDHAGNVSIVGTLTVLVDDTPPTSHISVGEPNHTAVQLYIRPILPSACRLTMPAVVSAIPNTVSMAVRGCRMPLHSPWRVKATTRSHTAVWIGWDWWKLGPP